MNSIRQQNDRDPIILVVKSKESAHFYPLNISVSVASWTNNSAEILNIELIVPLKHPPVVDAKIEMSEQLGGCFDPIAGLLEGFSFFNPLHLALSLLRPNQATAMRFWLREQLSIFTPRGFYSLPDCDSFSASTRRIVLSSAWVSAKL